MSRTREDVLKDIQEHPERHRHSFIELDACCTIDKVVDMALFEAHTAAVGQTNGGVACDTVSGPCACGAWH